MKKATELKDIYNNFGLTALVGEELDPETGIYVDTIEARTNDRYNSPLRKLYDACTGESSDFIQILLGHRGCGKSTEINKLEQEFLSKDYIVKKINCAVETNLSTIEVFDIIYIILQSLINIVEEHKIKGIDVNNKIIVRALNYFDDTEIITRVTENKVESVEAGMGLDLNAIVNIFAKGKMGIQYNTETIAEIKSRIKKNNEDWFNCIDFLCEKIYEQKKKRPIIIFENFDKIIDISKVLDIFKSGYISSEKIRTYCIFTFPIGLTYNPLMGQIQHYFEQFTFPMIEVKKRNGETNETGVDAIKKIIEKRADLNLFEEGCLDLLIEKTGGSLRELFSCIRFAAKRAEYRAEQQREVKTVSREDIEKSLTKVYDNQGDYPKALEYCQKALKICEKVLGAEHPNTKFVRKNYERLLFLHQF
ncbi:MAG: tetratricopeptide repeat protein [Prevotellaceae bacterium]|jgi:tetratricopeptide (TPR) repeat protein|nr:tetratricopeptide repeat protein [Prevotellaceae bacterium]